MFNFLYRWQEEIPYFYVTTSVVGQPESRRARGSQLEVEHLYVEENPQCWSFLCVHGALT